MPNWESDRSVDERYDEWCDTCQDDTEHCMGECLECDHRPWPPKNAPVKKNITTVQKTPNYGTIESGTEEDNE